MIIFYCLATRFFNTLCQLYMDLRELSQRMKKRHISIVSGFKILGIRHTRSLINALALKNHKITQ